jgi:hypothetical protein
MVYRVALQEVVDLAVVAELVELEADRTHELEELE